MAYTQTAAAYSGFRTPQAVTRRRSFSGRTNSFAYSPQTQAGAYDDYSRYPLNEQATGAYDEYAGYGDYANQAQTTPYQQTPYQGYSSQGYTTPRLGTTPRMGSTPRLSNYYGNGAYDDLAIGTSRSRYGDRDYDYGVYPTTTAVAPMPRHRRSSSVSFYNRYTGGPQRTSYYQGYGRSTIIKFKAKSSFRSGLSLADAVSGVKLSGGDYIRWHEINADARGRIYLRVNWNGYSALTYEIPVDSFDSRVRLSSLARRVARGIIHFMQSNGIALSLDRVKLYQLEEISYGTWKPVFTIR